MNGDRSSSPWWVYVLASTVRTVTYVGCTNDVPRRVRQHNGELSGGARFTQRWRPWELKAVHGPFSGRGDAQRAERRVKCLRGRERLSPKASELVRPLTSVNGPIPSRPRGGAVSGLDLPPVGTPLGVDPRGFDAVEETREHIGDIAPSGDLRVVVGEAPPRCRLLSHDVPEVTDSLVPVLREADGDEIVAEGEGESGGGHVLTTEPGRRS